MKRDCVFNPTVDEPPQIEGCVLHSHKRAIKTFTKSTEGVMTQVFTGVHYGLCEDCLILLKNEPRHQEAIEEEIAYRLKTLKKSKEH